ncbi:MAG: carboxypeptidase-like regulatory domain-containing protein [Terriglobia bacterium]
MSVKDAASDQPLPNARLTLIFKEPRKLKRDKGHSFSAKTNPQGRYKFVLIPKGTVRLVVTAERHQSFGQDFEIEEDNPVLEVKLKKPQPLL